MSTCCGRWRRWCVLLSVPLLDGTGLLCAAACKVISPLIRLSSIYCWTPLSALCWLLATAVHVAAGELLEVNQCIPDCDPVEVARGECDKYKMMTCATPGAVPVIQAPPPAPLMPLCIYISENMLGATTDVDGTWETATSGPMDLPAGAVAEEVGTFCPGFGTTEPYYHLPTRCQFETLMAEVQAAMDSGELGRLAESPVYQACEEVKGMLEGVLIQASCSGSPNGR